MITIIYNHRENSMREFNSKEKGRLGYHKEDKTFSCEASDLDCAGVPDLPEKFILRIEENGHTTIFRYNSIEKDDEGEIQYWEYVSSNNFKFIVFND